MSAEILDLKKNPAQNQPPIPEKTDRVLSWHAPEYTHTEKRLEWFLILGGICVALVISALVLENYLFAFFIMVAGILIGWFGNKAPRNINFAVTHDGVRIDQRLYEFANLKSFWIFYDPPLFNEISIQSKKIIVPRLTVPLGEMPPEKVRDILRRFLPEEKQEEPLITLISRILGF